MTGPVDLILIIGAPAIIKVTAQNHLPKENTREALYVVNTIRIVIGTMILRELILPFAQTWPERSP